MTRTIRYDDIEEGIIDDYLLIDLRSPTEYIDGTIPGAINIPLFDDKERAEVGTIYRQESPEKAKEAGIKIVSQKLPEIYVKVDQLSAQYKHLVFFCARGGMRSNSVASLLEALNINALRLEDGYKGYRNHVLANLPMLIKNIKFIVLYGNTGTGKTFLLEKLKEKGMDTLDLEGCANHRGSTLGCVGLGEQNSQKTFESLIYLALINKKTNTVFIEGESKRIGKDIIPDYLFEAMKNGIHVRIDASIEKRVENILKDYVHNTDGELIEALSHMKRHLGNEKIERYTQLIESHDYQPVIQELMEKYYDPLYEHHEKNYSTTINSDDLDEATEALINLIDEYILSLPKS